MTKERTICFLILPHVHLLDLAGPLQVFDEASSISPGLYNVTYCAPDNNIMSEQRLRFCDLQHFNAIKLKAGDFIIVPGVSFGAFISGKLKEVIQVIKPWLENQLKQGVQIASICSGSLILAEAGLLNGRKCTSHWMYIDFMKEHFPLADVQLDVLYVKDKSIYTSAGMSSGIDMALAILESNHGPVLTSKVARTLVVYMRRNDSDSQETIYLDYRTHFNPLIHRVQDYIISHPDKNPDLDVLASIGNTSVRTLTRTFKKTTGHTIIEFKKLVKLELAKTLIHNRDYSVEKISSMCGFKSGRQLRRIWKSKFGSALHSKEFSSNLHSEYSN